MKGVGKNVNWQFGHIERNENNRIGKRGEVHGQARGMVDDRNEWQGLRVCERGCL